MQAKKFHPSDVVVTTADFIPIPQGAMATVIEAIDTRQGPRYMVEEISTGRRGWFFESEIRAAMVEAES